MNNGQRIIAALLTVACVLLAANLMANGTRAAHAQYGASEPRDPKVVTGALAGTKVFRFWSDGAVDVSEGSFPVGECSDWHVECTVNLLPGF